MRRICVPEKDLMTGNLNPSSKVPPLQCLWFHGADDHPGYPDSNDRDPVVGQASSISIWDKVSPLPWTQKCVTLSMGDILLGDMWQVLIFTMGRPELENVKSFTRTNINKPNFTPRKACKSRHFWHFKPTKQNL